MDAVSAAAEVESYKSKRKREFKKDAPYRVSKEKGNGKIKKKRARKDEKLMLEAAAAGAATAVGHTRRCKTYNSYLSARHVTKCLHRAAAKIKKRIKRALGAR